MLYNCIKHLENHEKTNTIINHFKFECILSKK